MAGGPPSLAVGAESSLGYILQTAQGTANTVTNTAQNWAPITANTLLYDTGQHLIATGSGSRGAEQYGAPGPSHISGDFETLLFGLQSANLLAYFFGTDSITGTGPYVHTLSPSLPKLLTLEDQWDTQSYQLTDCMLDTLDLTSSRTEFKLKYGVLGGDGGTAISSGAPTFTTDSLALAWPHVTAATLPGSVVVGAFDSFNLSLKNGVRQFYGGGALTPSRIRGGQFHASGKYGLLFDSAAAATHYANYIAGTEANIAVTINNNASNKHVITLPNARLTKHPKKWQLAEFVMVDVEFMVRKPMNVTWAVTNTDNAAYV